LVAVVEEAVHQERHRDVEAEHQDRDDRRLDRLLPEERQEAEEEERRDPAFLQGVAPAGRVGDALARRALLLVLPASGPRLSFRSAPRPRARGTGVDPPALRPAMLAAALLLGLGHVWNLAEEVLDHMQPGIEAADRRLLGIVLERRLGREPDQLG